MPSLGDCRWKDSGRSKKSRRTRKAELEKGRACVAQKKMEMLRIGKNQKEQEDMNLIILQITRSVLRCVKRIHTALIKTV